MSAMRIGRDAGDRRASVVRAVLACVVATALLFRSTAGDVAVTVDDDPDLPTLNVHLVPHSHDDVGWLKTVDQYYVGSRTDMQRAGVRYILDSTIRALLENPTRKFIYVEIAFFERWWTEQTDKMKINVKRLVKTGQLEFINGGWVMNDEATVYYQSVIDQMTLGHKFLKDTFDVKPTIGWSIDPFGHSAQQASMLTSMGFHTFLMGRIDDADRSRRKISKEMEFIWEPSRSLGSDHKILGAVTPEGYGAPDGFCFDILCNDEPIQDRDDLFDNNVHYKAFIFASHARSQASYYRGSDVMLTMGSDFQYQDAFGYFDNMDRLIKFFEANFSKYKLNVFYSTPSAYFATRHAMATSSFSTTSDDFFPYGTSGNHGFWTGYFTSRPALKRFERTSNAHLQACKQLKAVAETDGDDETLKRAMGVIQHHDGVSGTERQHVADDYAKRLSLGIDQCNIVMNNAFHKLSGLDASHNLERCGLLNITICPTSQDNQEFVIMAYNPLGQKRSEFVSVPVTTPFWVVSDSEGRSVSTQIVPSIPTAASTLESAPYLLIFNMATEALGFATYSIVSSQQKGTVAEWKSQSQFDDTRLKIESNFLIVNFDQHGKLKSIENKLSGQQTDLEQSWAQYESNDGDQVSGTHSGAYIFRPKSQMPTPFSVDNTPHTWKLLTGPLVSMLYQEFSPGLSQIIRLYVDSQEVEFDFTVGPIDVSDNTGREVVNRFNSPSINSSDRFITDSNGREMIQRRRNFRATWDYSSKEEPVAGNYYPITTGISIEGEDMRMSVLTDRAQGGTSMSSGSIEIMVHRRLLDDDHLGVEEPLNELGSDGKGLVIRGRHYLLIGGIAGHAKLLRQMQERIAHPMSLWFLGGPAPQMHRKTFSGISQDLPANVNIITMESMRDRSIQLIRLGHMFGVEEDPVLSLPARVDLATLFPMRCIKSVVELTLSANQEIFTVLAGNRQQASDLLDNRRFDVVLKAMEIRTWRIELSECANVAM